MKAAYIASKASECWDWITVDEFHKIVTQAWKRAKDNCYPPNGQRWIEQGEPWSSPADFADGLTRLLVLHVQAKAHGAGIPGNEYAPAQLSAWYGPEQKVTP